MDKLGFMSCNKLVTLFVVFLIALTQCMVLITVISMYNKNYSFSVFEGFSKVLGRWSQNNVVSEVFPGKIENGAAIKRSAMNITADVGMKNGPLTSSTNISTPIRGNIDDHNDKMIDGLLASGFDEASCMSRFQSHLYRKPSLHKPSPYLISKLRNYEAIHRWCGPNTRPYKKAMEKITTNSNKSHGSSDHAADSSMCKYVVWTPANGLGNRMISIVATFLYAILTERTLLVRFHSDMNGLFCEPFLNSTWILPENSTFWNEHVVTYQSILDKDNIKSNYNNSTKDLYSMLPSTLLLILRNINGTEKFFHCDHNQEILNKVPLLIIQSDQYFVPSLFMTPSFNTQLNRMFPEKDMVFHHAARYLFSPSNEAWGQITGFYKSYMEKADEKIGIQVRNVNPATTPHQEVMDLLLNCTIKNKILPNVDMKNSVASSITGKNQTLIKAVIVASLYSYYGDNLRAMYPNRPTANGEVIEIYQPSHEEEQKFNDNVHNMKAWTEMYLLSLSDVLVTTAFSTFGYVAQGLGGLKPWQLYRMESNGTYFPSCERDLSAEPCFHRPPKHECGGKVKEKFAASFPNLCECKDFDGGVKLAG